MLDGGIVRFEDCQSEWFRRWMAEMGEAPIPGRKRWEHASIVQAMAEHGIMEPGRRVLGFGVGRERTPSLLAGYGVDVVATDQALNPKAEHDWLLTGQMSTQLDDLYFPEVVTREQFDAHVTFETCDMNAIPERHHGAFDAVYQACSMDHLGSFEAGFRFVEEALRCVKPGGWAFMTTEYDLGLYPHHVVDRGDTVFYRQQDVEGFARRLEAAGHYVVPIDYARGTAPQDGAIDPEPHSDPNHLNLMACGIAVTSIRFWVQRGA